MVQLYAPTLHVAAVQHKELEDFACRRLTCGLAIGSVMQKAVADNGRNHCNTDAPSSNKLILHLLLVAHKHLCVTAPSAPLDTKSRRACSLVCTSQVAAHQPKEARSAAPEGVI